MMHSFALFHHASGEHTVISDDSAFSAVFLSLPNAHHHLTRMNPVALVSQRIHQASAMRVNQ
jgi:hypothetical protein